MIKLQLTLLFFALLLATQLSPRMDSLVAAVRPLLPFPAASADGELPADNSAAAKWFVVWPTGPEETRITVKANPLNPDVQKASVEAMKEINAAIAAAERRAQASYDQTIEQLRRTGKGGTVESVTLDDEGVAGERIDAELEVTIELAAAESFEVTSGQPPTVTSGTNGAAWLVSVPPNTYRLQTGERQREHFRAAEARVYFAVSERPLVERAAAALRFRVNVPAATGAFAVVLRGNPTLVTQLATEADWSKIVNR